MLFYNNSIKKPIFSNMYLKPVFLLNLEDISSTFNHVKVSPHKLNLRQIEAIVAYCHSVDPATCPDGPGKSNFSDYILSSMDTTDM